MESPFEYNGYVTGASFIGRNKELKMLSNLIRERSNILIYGPARIGKRSLIYNTLDNLRQEGYQFTQFNMNLFNVRCIEAFLLRYTNIILGKYASSPMEMITLARKYIPSAPYILNEKKPGACVLTNRNKDLLSESQIMEILDLPARLSQGSQSHSIIYFEQFQDILLFEDPSKFFALLDRVWRTHTSITYIITGERTNAMHGIFYESKYFFKFAEHLKLVPIDENVFANFIEKCFLKAGKVINPEMALQIYRTVEGDPWYCQQLASICFDLTKGYMNDKIFDEALGRLINLHSFLFHSITFGLTRHQVRFLKAMLDGVTQLSSADILYKYNLNSSANVFRIKGALEKKEIISYNVFGEPFFLDPLLKLWMKHYYFVK